MPLSTIGLFDLFAGSTLPVFAGVLTRIAGVCFGGMCFSRRNYSSSAWAAFCSWFCRCPTSDLRRVAECFWSVVVILIFSELLIGVCLGLSISFLATVRVCRKCACQCRRIELGRCFYPVVVEAGVARLCGWVGLASFVAAVVNSW